MENKISEIDFNSRTFPECSIIQKRFNDIDGLRHINNGVQQSYFDIGRANYLKRIYGEYFYCNEEVLLVASYKTDFKAQIKFEDKIEVCSSIYHLGNKSLRMIQVLRGIDNGKIYTISDSVMVSVNLKTGNSIQLPIQWREKILEIEQNNNVSQ